MKLLVPILSGDSKNGLLQLPEIIAGFKEKARMVDEEESPFVEDNLESLMDLLDKRGGLKWGLTHLNENIGPLPGCTLGQIFARVESGKTTFVASQVQSFVGQLSQDQKIVWICNEEHGRFVKLRSYQSILNLTSPEILEYLRTGQKEELEYRYRESGGSKLHIHYDPNVSMEGIRALLERNPPRLVIVDIADHVSFRGGNDLAGPARLGEVYRRFRSLAGHFSCDILTVGQASAECDGRKVLQMDHMHNSKTDKPSALDYCIGMGKTYNPEDAELRWLTICKNKIGCTTKETAPIRIDTTRGRLYDVC
jgi:replicative DNA helicase